MRQSGLSKRSLKTRCKRSAYPQNARLRLASYFWQMRPFTTVNQSATAEDYSPTSGTLTIAASEQEGVITVVIADDELTEENETFTVQLSNPSHATITDNQALGTITDDDQPATSVTLANVSVHRSTSGYASTLLALLLVSGLLLAMRRKEEEKEKNHTR